MAGDRNSGWTGEIPVGPFQDAVERSELGMAEIAHRAGWTYARDGRRVADVTRLRRALGLTAYSSHGRKHTNTLMRYETAVTLTRALDLDPVEMGV